MKEKDPFVCAAFHAGSADPKPVHDLVNRWEGAQGTHHSVAERTGNGERGLEEDHWMSPKTSDAHAWVTKHLAPLMKSGDDLEKFDATLPARMPSYDKGEWTGFKLIALKYYLKPYLTILARRTKVAYVDFFAGPGLDRIGKRRVELPGSPLLPMMIQEAPSDRWFSHFFLCEQNPEYFEALNRRAQAFLPHPSDLTLTCSDANEFVHQLPALVARNGIGHCLVFVDPEGLEWSWAAMRMLATSVRCDVVINFPSSGLQRVSTRQDVRPTISRFLGIPESELPDVIDEEWALNCYRQNLARLGKDISTEIRITDFGAYHYDLIPAVTSTSTGSPWFTTWTDLRKRIDGLHGKYLGIVAQQVDGVLGEI